MAAQDAVVLENYLKLFVETKVGESILLEFSTGCVYIKPEKKQGSITLGSFWARVIQAYFPLPEFTYKKYYSSTHASEVLQTVADGYTIRIYLRTGLVTVEGDVVYEWFKVIFRKVIRHYDRSTYAHSADYRENQKAFDARKSTQRKERKVLFQDSIQRDVIDEKRAFICSDIEMPELDSMFTDEDDECTRRSSSMQLVPHDSSSQSLSCSIGLKDGNSYVYPMWKQLLNKWLSIDGCKVFVCSKQIDVARYKDLTTMAYKNRLNTGLEAIYTNLPGSSSIRMPTVKDLLLKGHTADEQLFIEYRVINKTKYAATKSVACNFIAGYFPTSGVVELMLTSATFDAEGLDLSQNLHTVTMSKISHQEFRSNFLDVLGMI